MADDPASGQPDFDPLPGPPRRPEADGLPADGGGPPLAPPSAGAGQARPDPVPAPGERRSSVPTSGRRGLAAWRTPRRMAAAAVAVLLVGAVVVAVTSSGGGESGDGGGEARPAPAAAQGKDLALLDGRLTVVAPEGWEPLESAAETASIRVNLRDATGRELLGTLVLTALPGAGPLESTLTVDGGTRFEVAAAGGPIQATAVADRGQVLAGAIRPDGRFLFSLSVFTLDGQPTDAALLQKLFSEQVAPQLRFP